jgi:DNA-binding transcriptional MerR regulator
MEASRLSGLPESTLRYYESIGLIEPIRRDPSSRHRTYSEDDVNLIIAVACLSATGMTIEDMRAYLCNRALGPDASDEQIKLLEQQRRRLKQEAKALKLRQRYVDHKISYWQALKNGDGDEIEAVTKATAELATELKRSKVKQLNNKIEGGTT